MIVRMFGYAVVLFLCLLSLAQNSDASPLVVASAATVPDCGQRQYWQAQSSQHTLNDLMVMADTVMSQPIPPWSDDDYLEFSRTGARVRGEQMMKSRSSLLAPLVIAECLRWDAHYLPKILALIDQYLSEPSWLYPAHDADLKVFKGQLEKVDLATADRAHQLSLALYLLGDNIPPALKTRILDALRVRVWQPVLNSLNHPDQNQWWLTAENNWNAVCLRGVVLSALIANPVPAEKELFASVAQEYIKYFLNGYPEDGYALEGPGYWGYGFGAFVDLGYGLSLATNRQVDLFVLPKVHEIARYPLRFQMQADNVAAFGDAKRTVKFDPILLAFLKRYLQNGGEQDWSVIAKDFKHHPSASLSAVLFRLATPDNHHVELADAKIEDSHFFFYAQEGILKSCGAEDIPMCITFKAGGNGVSHVHDDVGSYVIGVQDEQPVGDVGIGQYSKKTFGRDRQQISWVNSWGHPVPLVDGQKQKKAGLNGSKFNLISATHDLRALTLDLSGVYDNPGILRLERNLLHEIHPSPQLVLTDQFAFKDQRDFEVAITTLGRFTIVSDNQVVFIDKQIPLQLTVIASAPVEFSNIDVTEEGLTFKRLSVRFRDKQNAGWIKQVYQVLK